MNNDQERELGFDEEIEFTAEEDGVRLDAYCARLTNLSRSRIELLCKEGNVFLNGTKAKKNAVIKFSDRLRLILPQNTEIDALPEEIPLTVLYEDHDIIVVDKPAGMVVHPAPGNPNGTLVNALLGHCKDSLSGINGKIRPGIVHRLDKDTDGVILCAKNDEAHLRIAQAIKEHRYKKIYQAIVHGHPDPPCGTIQSAIGRSNSDRKKMANYPLNTAHTKNAVTHYRVLEYYSGYSLVELELETGRTHQIRLHMLHIGHPVADDPLYAPGRKVLLSTGQLLHAYRLTIQHPRTGKEHHFVSPLPDRFHQALEKIR